jgi:uncharacterized protein YuzE
MVVKYDKETDVIYIKLSDEKVKDSDESRPGVIIDYDNTGKVVGIEILQASHTVVQPQKLEYEIA